MNRRALLLSTALAAVAVGPTSARADAPEEPKGGVEAGNGAGEPAKTAVEPSTDPPKGGDVASGDDPKDKDKAITVTGYVEAFYQWNFNRPSNGITSYRGYDNRHNSITISNAVIDTGWKWKEVRGRVALQIGHTPNAYYDNEPSLPGSDGVGSSGKDTWKYLQQANVGWKAPVGRGLILEAGVFLASMGYETLAIKENWNWSRSNGVTGLPSYQTGAKATYEISDTWAVVGGVFNGWNNVTDNNDGKTVEAQLEYTRKDDLTASFSYMGGPERDQDAKEGRPWRHLFDAWAQWDATKVFAFAIESNGGFEKTVFGTHWWTSTGLYARAHPTEWLYLAVRGDRLWEERAMSALGESDPIFSPARRLTSFTATVDVRPVKTLSTRLEYRHDVSAGDAFFRRNVEGDGSEATPFVPNASTQNTLLLGVVAWFE
ncbi:MAG: outer membrane protein [Myxococcaceae bacterium]|nr:outer membrane protein [Myxococcaceae bacterium]